MKGPFHDHLKWPFRGEITIQIVNQDRDHDHVEMTIHYNDKTPNECTGRVTGSMRPVGWGDLIFPILDNAARRTQDDIITIRVVRVKIT